MHSFLPLLVYTSTLNPRKSGLHLHPYYPQGTTLKTRHAHVEWAYKTIVTLAKNERLNYVLVYSQFRLYGYPFILTKQALCTLVHVNTS